MLPIQITVPSFRSRANVMIATSVIVAGKLKFIVQNYQQQTANLIKIQAFLRRIEIYQIDLVIANIAFKNFSPL